MIYGILKTPETEMKASFITKEEFGTYVEEKIGKDCGVLISSDHLQILFNRNDVSDVNKKDNMFVTSKSGNVIRMRGNLIFTAIGMKDSQLVTDTEFEKEYSQMKANQKELFEKWFKE